MSIKMLIADDHEVVRRGVISLLSGTDIKIVGEAKSGAEMIQVVKCKPDVVLLDIRMNDQDGLDALEKFHKQFPGTKVVILSTYDNPTYVARAHALGASDYVLKGCSKTELVSAITSAVEGHGPIRTGEMRRVAYAMSTAADQKHEDLPITPREMQVLRHIALGLSNKEIARSLEISVETVKEHVQNLLRKLGVTDRTQAAVLAVRKGVV